MRRPMVCLIFIMLLALMFSACGDVQPPASDVPAQPSPTVTAAPTAPPTESPIATQQPSPSVMAVPSPTVMPTPSPTVTAAPTATPTKKPDTLQGVVGGTPAVSHVFKPVASGTKVISAGTDTEPVTIDASNTKDGYVMIRAKSTRRLKVIITGPSGIAYTYNLNGADSYEVFQFSDGSGSYKVAVYCAVTGNKYATLAAETLAVSLTDANAPFLHPNQYVNYSKDSAAIAFASTILREEMKDLERIAAIYNYVVTNTQYDYAKAASVKSGYIPDIDKVFAEKKGICFDYAALMTAMLRAYGIPTKLVVGYTGAEYHAWISTYTAESGWIEGTIFFNGSDWKLMDPTFASTANSSAEIMAYIAKTSNYQAKYIY
ncbi:MAG: transglutaminase domain-containing protein [Clostridia bacterium]|nr:transglutaminase domain-containing protein [Clostridia bacterium]